MAWNMSVFFWLLFSCAANPGNFHDGSSFRSLFSIPRLVSVLSCHVHSVSRHITSCFNDIGSGGKSPLVGLRVMDNLVQLFLCVPCVAILANVVLCRKTPV